MGVRSNNLLGLFFLFLIGGATIGFQGAKDLYRVWAARSWPCVEGQIMSSKVESAHKRGETYFLPQVRYRYAVGGRDYVGNSVSLADPGGRPHDELLGKQRLGWKSHDDAEKVAAQYPAGKQVLVYYDPDAPHLCALEKGVPVRTVYEVWTGATTFLIGLAGALWCHARLRSSRSSGPLPVKLKVRTARVRRTAKGGSRRKASLH